MKKKSCFLVVLCLGVIIIVSLYMIVCITAKEKNKVIEEDFGEDIAEWIWDFDLTETIPSERSNESKVAGVPWPEVHKGKVREAKREQKLILIGDSITQLFEKDGAQAWQELLTRTQGKIINLGFGGDHTQNVIWRLQNGEFPYGIDPKNVVLMIGTNNGGEPKDIAAGIRQIVQIIHIRAPHTKILLFAIFPRGAAQSPERIKNDAVNKELSKYNGLWGVEYLDISKDYLNKNGELKEQLFVDGLHLSEKGYDIWKNKILSAVS